MTVTMKPRNARARDIIVNHIHEFIEKNGMDAAKKAGFSCCVCKQRKYPKDGWHEDARVIAEKILTDQEFIRCCLKEKKTKQVVNWNWFYEHIRTAKGITKIGKPLPNSSISVHKMAKTIDKKQGLYLEFEDVELAGHLFETGKSHRKSPCAFPLGSSF